MEFKEKRHTETVYLPTKKWLRSRNPQTKKGIIAWYKREQKILDKRRFQKVTRRLEAYTAEQDRTSKKLYRQSKQPEDFDIECWRLSEQDYEVYRGLLEVTYQRLKKAHNAKIKAKLKSEAAERKDTEG